MCATCKNSYHRTCLTISYNDFKKFSKDDRWQCSGCTKDNSDCTICKKFNSRWIMLICCKFEQNFHKACVAKLTKTKTPPSPEWICIGCNEITTAKEKLDLQKQISIVPETKKTTLSKGLKIGHLNCRDIKSLSKLDDIKWLLHEYQFDIFGITETWLTNHTADGEIFIAGYQLFRLDRPNIKNWKNRGGGLLMYIREDYDVETTQHSFPKPIECLKLTIRPPHMKKINFHLIYRPPNSSNSSILCFENEFLNSLNTESYFFGDLNVDMLTTTTNKITLNNLMDRFNYVQVINQPTRVSDNSSTLIDLIICNNPKFNNAGVLPVSTADHKLVYSVRKQPKQSTKTCHVKRIHSFKNTDYEKFKKDLTEAPWWIFEHCKSASKVYDLFKTIVQHVINIHAPLKKVRVRDSTPMWWTPTYFKLMRTYNNLRSKCSNKDDFLKTKILRNKLTALKKSVKSNKIASLIDENQYGNPKICWKLLNNEVGREKVPVTIPKLKVGNFDHTGKNSCEVLASEFSKTKSFCPSPGSSHTSNNEKFTSPPFELKEVHCSETESLLAKLDSAKSSGVENIPTSVFKKFSNTLSAPLTKLFNRSLSESEFPTMLKKALVTPLYKGKGKKCDPNSYRPISILPTTSKIFEQLVYTHLINFLDEHNLLCENQHGFRKNRSTESALVMFTNDVRTSMDNREITAAVFVDFTKAFDLVVHSILLKKLESFNISSKMIKWFKSYLTDRELAVKIGDVQSNFHKITRSVPQGSILGPLLFSLYVNDIPSRFSRCKSLLYADDLVLYATGSSISEVTSKLQQDLDQLQVWCNQHGMVISIPKTKVMVLGSSKSKFINEQLNLSVNGTLLENVPEFRYLGVKIDKLLQFKSHSDCVMKRTAHRIRLLNSIKYAFPKEKLKEFCVALCISIPSYCLHIWANDTYIAKCDVLLHKLMTKVFYCFKSKHKRSFVFSELLETPNWLSFKDKRILQIVKFVFRHFVQSSNLRKMCSSFLKYCNSHTRIITRKPKNLIQIQIQSTLFECQKTKSTNTCWSPFGDTI